MVPLSYTLWYTTFSLNFKKSWVKPQMTKVGQTYCQSRWLVLQGMLRQTTIRTFHANPLFWLLAPIFLMHVHQYDVSLQLIPNMVLHCLGLDILNCNNYNNFIFLRWSISIGESDSDVNVWPSNCLKLLLYPLLNLQICVYKMAAKQLSYSI